VAYDLQQHCSQNKIYISVPIVMKKPCVHFSEVSALGENYPTSQYPPRARINTVGFVLDAMHQDRWKPNFLNAVYLNRRLHNPSTQCVKTAERPLTNAVCQRPPSARSYESYEKQAAFPFWVQSFKIASIYKLADRLTAHMSPILRTCLQQNTYSKYAPVEYLSLMSHIRQTFPWSQALSCK